MINGVLVERTVRDVIPILQTNSEGLKKVLDDLLKQYKKQQDDMEKWKVRLSRFYVFEVPHSVHKTRALSNFGYQISLRH